MRRLCVFLLLFCFLIETKAQQASTDTTKDWKTYSYPADHFTIRSPQMPLYTKLDHGTHYQLLWDEQKRIVINLMVTRTDGGCAAWQKWASNLQGNAVRLITVSGIPALESRAQRNELQAGYSLQQCVDGRIYGFESGWPKAETTPPIIADVIHSFQTSQ